MKDKDLDLLLALIEGRLAAGDEAAARARVSKDTELEAELDMQRLIVARLHQLPQPSLSETERDRLHGDLRRQLHLTPATAPATAPRSHWWSRWAPISGIAVAAVVLAGIVYVIPRTSDQDTGANDAIAADVLETEAGASPQAEDPVADPERSPDTTGADDAATSLQPLGSDANAPDDAAGEGAPAATSTESDGTEAADEAAPIDILTIGALGNAVPAVGDLLEILRDRMEHPERVLDYFRDAGTETFDPARLEACIESLAGIGRGRPLVPVATGVGETGAVVVIVFFSTTESPFTVAVVSAEGCDLVAFASAGS